MRSKKLSPRKATTEKRVVHTPITHEQHMKIHHVVSRYQVNGDYERSKKLLLEIGLKEHELKYWLKEQSIE